MSGLAPFKSGAFLFTLLLLTACTTTRSIEDIGFQTLQQDVNKKAASEPARITFKDEESIVARGLHIAPDSSSFFVKARDGVEELHVVQTSEIVDVSFRKPTRQLLHGSLLGIAVGVVSTLALGVPQEVCFEKLQCSFICFSNWDYEWKTVCRSESRTATLSEVLGTGLGLGLISGVWMRSEWPERYSFGPSSKKARCNTSQSC